MTQGRHVLYNDVFCWLLIEFCRSWRFPNPTYLNLRYVFLGLKFSEIWQFFNLHSISVASDSFRCPYNRFHVICNSDRAAPILSFFVNCLYILCRPWKYPNITQLILPYVLIGSAPSGQKFWFTLILRLIPQNAPIRRFFDIHDPTSRILQKAIDVWQKSSSRDPTYRQFVISSIRNIFETLRLWNENMDHKRSEFVNRKCQKWFRFCQSELAVSAEIFRNELEWHNHETFSDVSVLVFSTVK